jgi:hypothetical protein
VKIAFDIDGVVLKSIDIILGRINELTGRGLTPDDLRAWDLEPLGLDEETLRQAVLHLYVQPRVEPYERATEVLSRIHRATKEPLLFITGRHNLDNARRQLEALPWNPTVPHMVVSGGDRNKQRYIRDHSVDFIIEDDTKHLAEYLDDGIGVGLMVQPWNRHTDIPVTMRFHGWAELEEWYFSET